MDSGAQSVLSSAARLNEYLLKQFYFVFKWFLFIYFMDVCDHFVPF